MPVGALRVGDVGPRHEHLGDTAQVVAENAGTLGVPALRVEVDAQLGLGELVGQARAVAVDPRLRLSVGAVAQVGHAVERLARGVLADDLLRPAEEREHLSAAALRSLLRGVTEEVVRGLPLGADVLLELVHGRARRRVAARPEDPLELDAVLVVLQLLQERRLVGEEEHTDETREPLHVDLARSRGGCGGCRRRPQHQDESGDETRRARHGRALRDSRGPGLFRGCWCGYPSEPGPAVAGEHTPGELAFDIFLLR